MRALPIALTALLLTAGTAAADTEHITRTFQLAPEGDLRLNNFAGRVHIAGADGRQVTIDAVRRGTREQLDAIKLEINQEGATITIQANRRTGGWFSWWGHKDVVDTDFDITVPRRTNLRVQVFSSQVDVSGIDADVSVHSFSAPVRVDAVSGRLTVHSFSGPITVKPRGGVDANAMTLDTFSGGVDLRVPENAHAIADFRSFSGRLTSSLPLLFRSTSRRETTAELSGPGPAGHIRVKTFSGNLRIDR